MRGNHRSWIGLLLLAALACGPGDAGPDVPEPAPGDLDARAEESGSIDQSFAALADFADRLPPRLP